MKRGERMAKLSALDWVVLILVTVGAVNWGLVGLFNWNIVEAILGSIPILVTIVYVLVALSGLYKLYDELK